MAKSLMDCDGDTRGWVKHDQSSDPPKEARRSRKLLDVVRIDGWTYRRMRVENVTWSEVSHWRETIA